MGDGMGELELLGGESRNGESWAEGNEERKCGGDCSWAEVIGYRRIELNK